jgi:hypothetical protein
MSNDELRARVSSWPPLRLTRMRCERESVGVVLPDCVYVSQRKGAEVRSIGLDVHKDFAEVAEAVSGGGVQRVGRVICSRVSKIIAGFGRH